MFERLLANFLKHNFPYQCSHCNYQPIACYLDLDETFMNCIDGCFY